jgi:hypothetical protein
VNHRRRVLEALQIKPHSRQLGEDSVSRVWGRDFNGESARATAPANKKPIAFPKSMGAFFLQYLLEKSWFPPIPTPFRPTVVRWRDLWKLPIGDGPLAQ